MNLPSFVSTLLLFFIVTFGTSCGQSGDDPHPTETPAAENRETSTANDRSAAETDTAPELPLPELPGREPQKKYRHPAGFEFQYPASWQITAEEDFLVLTPPHVAKDRSGSPLEMILIGGEEAEGISRLDNPEVISFFVSQFPKLKYQKDLRKLPTLLGDGVTFSLHGRSGNREETRAFIHAALYRGWGIYLALIGTSELTARRRATARRIFTSFGWGKGQLDEKLTGIWRKSSSSSSSVTTSGYIGSSTTSIWRFTSDGRAAWSSSTRLMGHVEGAGGQVTLDPAAGEGRRSQGRWFVDGTELTIIWEDGGFTTWEYSVFRHTDNQIVLKLLVPGEKKPDYYYRQ